MNFTILIPHFKNAKATAYCIYKLLKHKGKHEIEIVVIDNNAGDGSANYFNPFGIYTNIVYLPYPKNKLQSHGIAFDYAILSNLVQTDWFITVESDSFPTEDNWLDNYEELINNGCDSAGSMLQLSGGVYQHPCGSLYSKDVWREAKEYCENIQYTYFPNMNKMGSFDYHLMIHNKSIDRVIMDTIDFFDLSSGYRGLSKDQILDKAFGYSPTVNPFHNGMGKANESINTYGKRNFETEIPNILLDNKTKLISRVGYEPGQWLSYFMFATGKKVSTIPTDVKWLPNRENQQQEYTKMENGFTHIWAGSSYLDMKGGYYNDVYEFKKNQIEELYNSMPDKFKTKQHNEVNNL